VTDWYQFSCPSCEAAFEIDEPARTELLETGCVRCGMPLTAAAFSPLTSPPEVIA
jgi:hypothetical protein